MLATQSIKSSTFPKDTALFETLTWLVTGLMRQLANKRSICSMLKFEMPMLLTSPKSTNFSMAFQVSTKSTSLKWNSFRKLLNCLFLSVGCLRQIRLSIWIFRPSFKWSALFKSGWIVHQIQVNIVQSKLLTANSAGRFHFFRFVFGVP